MNTELPAILFAGHRRGGVHVLRNGEPFSPARSQAVYNHSPDGFEWGYGGSGPAQLALALLLECTSQEKAQRFYQRFKFDVVAGLPDNWVLADTDILAWLAKNSMMVGQKVVCVDDRFPAGIEKFYTALPKKDVTYVIRNVSIGVNWKGEAGEVCLHLIGLVNPKSNKPPFPERGFNAERFRPLDEIKTAHQQERTVTA